MDQLVSFAKSNPEWPRIQQTREATGIGLSLAHSWPCRFLQHSASSCPQRGCCPSATDVTESLGSGNLVAGLCPCCLWMYYRSQASLYGGCLFLVSFKTTMEEKRGAEVRLRGGLLT